MGPEDIFPGRILKFVRHFERVEEKVQFLHADPGHLHARRADIFLKINFLVQHIGQAHKSKWNFVMVSIPDYDSCCQPIPGPGDRKKDVYRV